MDIDLLFLFWVFGGTEEDSTASYACAIVARLCVQVSLHGSAGD